MCSPPRPYIGMRATWFLTTAASVSTLICPPATRAFVQMKSAAFAPIVSPFSCFQQRPSPTMREEGRVRYFNLRSGTRALSVTRAEAIDTNQPDAVVSVLFVTHLFVLFMRTEILLEDPLLMKERVLTLSASVSLSLSLCPSLPPSSLNLSLPLPLSFSPSPSFLCYAGPPLLLDQY